MKPLFDSREITEPPINPAAPVIKIRFIFSFTLKYYLMEPFKLRFATPLLRVNSGWRLDSMVRKPRLPFGLIKRARFLLSFISREHKKKLIKFAFLQAFTGLLDLIGIGLIGLIGSLALTGVVASSAPNPTVVKTIDFLGLGGLELTSQVTILALVATSCLIGRSISAFYVSSRIFHFLGLEGALLSSKLASKILRKDVSHIEARTRQDSVFVLTSGSNKAALDVAGSIILALADISSLVLILTTLLILDALTALITFVLFGILGIALFKYLRDKATNLGRVNSQLFVSINNSILSTLENIRFIKTANLTEQRILEFNSLRISQSKALADLTVMPYISKYVFEVILVLGALLISAIQFLMHDAIQAIATLIVFLAAGGRLAPAALRLQQSSLLIKANISYTIPVLELYQESDKEVHESKVVAQDREFSGQAELANVDYVYPGSSSYALKDVNLKIPKNSFTAIVGPSGSGKSTLIDILLGLNTPQKGSVFISGMNPKIAFRKWPGKVGYVPQRTSLLDGTIAENIVYGRELTSDDQIWKSLRIANLEELVRSLEFGIHTPIGELGNRLSAGQQQRLGIARALFSEPELLVMDEATSSLDATTERELSQSLANLQSRVTLVVVAHRLSTVVKADKIVYMANGKILAEGSMEEVRIKIPEFEQQVLILGIKS
jgi:ABC-type multidrug transport system fused ATPase/permease subunit